MYMSNFRHKVFRHLYNFGNTAVPRGGNLTNPCGLSELGSLCVGAVTQPTLLFILAINLELNGMPKHIWLVSRSRGKLSGWESRLTAGHTGGRKVDKQPELSGICYSHDSGQGMQKQEFEE